MELMALEIVCRVDRLGNKNKTSTTFKWHIFSGIFNNKPWRSLQRSGLNSSLHTEPDIAGHFGGQPIWTHTRSTRSLSVHPPGPLPVPVSTTLSNAPVLFPTPVWNLTSAVKVSRPHSRPEAGRLAPCPRSCCLRLPEGTRAESLALCFVSRLPVCKDHMPCAARCQQVGEECNCAGSCSSGRRLVCRVRLQAADKEPLNPPFPSL